MRTTWRLAAVLAIAILAVTAIWVARSRPAACDPIEVLVDPSIGHLLPGGTVTYQWHPPTSGIHQTPGPDPGVYHEAIAEARQVHALELGRVIVQYSDAVADADVADLEGLASEFDDVVVAPASEIDDGAVIAFTAWEHRRLCSASSLSAARSFIRQFAGRGPGEP